MRRGWGWTGGRDGGGGQREGGRKAGQGRADDIMPRCTALRDTKDRKSNLPDDGDYSQLLTKGKSQTSNRYHPQALKGELDEGKKRSGGHGQPSIQTLESADFCLWGS